MVDVEVLQALADELDELRPELGRELAIVTDSAAAAERRSEAVANYTEIVGRLGQAAEIVELPALEAVAGFVAGNAGALGEIDAAEGSEPGRLALFEHWAEKLEAVLRAPADSDNMQAFAGMLQSAAWPRQADAASLIQALEAELAGAGESTAGIAGHRETVAEPEQVAVAFAPDINPQLVEAFLQETPIHVARFSESVQSIEAGPASDGELANLQRLAHTIKGSANITGVAGIANLTHHAEDILEHLNDQSIQPDPALAGLLVRCADCLEAMLEQLTGTGPGPDDSLDVLQSLLDWANRADRGELHGASGSPEAPQPLADEQDEADSSAAVAAEGPDDELTAPPAAPVPPDERPAVAATEASEAALRVSMARVDALLRLAGEMTTSIVRLAGFQRSLINRASQLGEQNLLVGQRLSALQDLVELRGVPSVRREFAGIGADPRDGFDPLELDEYNELHSATNALAETLTDVKEMSDGLKDELGDLNEMVLQQQQVSSELNAEVLSARMVPVQTIVARLQRAVRQACRATGKRAELTVTGHDMLVDSVILNSVADPLLHLLRNAVDHGIESPEGREAAGKPASGKIALEFAQQGETVVVSCEDDGGGFDLQRMREIAVDKGLIAPDVSLDDAQTMRLALLPGFTTRSALTQLSGRGIGLDVVHQNITDLRGSTVLERSPLGGVRVEVRVPLTLISMHVLLLRVGTRVFGVPSSTIEQILFSDAGTTSGDGRRQRFSYQGVNYSVISLHELLGYGEPPARAPDAAPEPLLLVSADEGPMAVSIDAVVDGRYLVVKQLGRYVPKARGVVGASILADGSVAPVLDVRDLMRAPALVQVDPTQLQALGDAALQAMPSVLIVDDSLSARRTLTQVVTEAGFEARTAVDGLEAIESIEKDLPDAVLLDMEMPRMNGLELAAHLRSEEPTRELPLVMVTSRSTIKHRDQAQAAGVDVFVTKPYEEAELTRELHRLIEGQ